MVFTSSSPSNSSTHEKCFSSIISLKLSPWRPEITLFVVTSNLEFFVLIFTELLTLFNTVVFLLQTFSFCDFGNNLLVFLLCSFFLKLLCRLQYRCLCIKCWCPQSPPLGLLFYPPQSTCSPRMSRQISRQSLNNLMILNVTCSTQSSLLRLQPAGQLPKRIRNYPSSPLFTTSSPIFTKHYLVPTIPASYLSFSSPHMQQRFLKILLNSSIKLTTIQRH